MRRSTTRAAEHPRQPLGSAYRDGMTPQEDEERDRAELAKRNAAWARSRLLIGIIGILVAAIALNLIWMWFKA